jgi:iron complex outermembrane receptor protein
MIGRSKSQQLLVASAIVGSLAWHSAAMAQGQTESSPPAPAAGATVSPSADTGGTIGGTNVSPSTTTPSGQIVGGQEVTANDIIVTATKRTERLENVPATIVAVTGQALETAGVTRFSDIALVAPGVQISRSGTYTQPAIRGITTSFAGGGQETNVALYIDGFYQSDQTGMNQDLSNIQDIQILKGPQGTLYGRNATGGAILITTRTPTDKWQVEANASYAWRFDDKIANFFAGGPIANGVKVSVSASWHKSDGYITDINRFAPKVLLDGTDYKFGGNGSLGGHSFNYTKYQHRGGKNVAPLLNWNVRPKLILEPTDNIKITLGYVHTYVSENKSQAYIMKSNRPGDNDSLGFTDQSGAACTPGQPVPAGVNPWSNAPNTVCYANASVARTGKFKTSMSHRPINVTKQDEGNAAIEWKMGDAGTLTGRIAFRHQTDLNAYELEGTVRHITNSALAYSSIGFNNRHTMTAQLDYSGNFGPLSILSGFFYYKDRFRSYTSNKAGRTAGVTLSNLDFRTMAWGAFIDGTYNINDKFFINAGVRYNYDRKRLKNTQWTSAALADPYNEVTGVWTEGATSFNPASSTICLPGGINGSPVAAPGCTLANPAYAAWKKIVGKAWTPHVVLRYNLSRGTNIYASWSRGFKAATINSGAPFNSLKPEKVDAFEVGIKTNRGGFRGEAAAFYYNYKNNQISAFNGTTTVTSNSGGAHVYGLDVSLSYKVPDMPLNLRGAFSYLHARYTDYGNAGNVTASSCKDPGALDNPLTPGNEAVAAGLSGAACQDVVGTNTTAIGKWTGRRLLRAPDWTASIGADYTLEGVFGGKLVFSATAQYSSRYAPQNGSWLCTYYTALAPNGTTNGNPVDWNPGPTGAPINPAFPMPINQKPGDVPGTNYCDPGQNNKKKGRFEENGWAQVNAQINWTDASEHYTIGVFANNINNVHYYLAYSQPGYGKNVVYNEPRAFGIRAGVKF